MRKDFVAHNKIERGSFAAPLNLHTLSVFIFECGKMHFSALLMYGFTAVKIFLRLSLTTARLFCRMLNIVH